MIGIGCIVIIIGMAFVTIRRRIGEAAGMAGPALVFDGLVSARQLIICSGMIE